MIITITCSGEKERDTYWQLYCCTYSWRGWHRYTKIGAATQMNKNSKKQRDMTNHDMVPDFQEFINRSVTLVVLENLHSHLYISWKFWYCQIKIERDIALFLKKSWNFSICLANFAISIKQLCHFFCCIFYSVHVILIW